MRGLFVGLCTLDVIQLVDRIPAANEKVTARAQTVAAGGPATNAAVAYRHLGGAATLLTGIGPHPLAAGITADLASCGVEVVDLLDGVERAVSSAADTAVGVPTPEPDEAELGEPPTVSTILVTAATGDRSVASRNAVGRQLPIPPGRIAALVAAADTVEVDGHHMALATAVARAARETGRRTVLDGGSWKPGTPELLRWIDVAVCSADFRPPGTSTPLEVLDFLAAAGVPWAAVTRGTAPVLWAGPDCGGEVPAHPADRVADTLGAGDVFHGALTHALSAPAALTPDAFPAALAYAATIAAASCASFGTRAWLHRPDGP